MTRYIGLDAHSESCTLAVLGASGKRLRYERLQTSADVLKSFIKEVPRPRQLCMEEGTLSEWLCEELGPVVDKLVVVMPDRTPGNKSDLLDACKLADDLRRDAIRRPVYKAPGCLRALREAARTHYTLQRDTASCCSQHEGRCRTLPKQLRADRFVGVGGGIPRATTSIRVADAISESNEVLVCRLVEGKVTFVHRRLWPALVKLAARFPKVRLGKIWEEHTETGAHRSRSLAFPKWVPKDVLKRGRGPVVQRRRDAIRFGERPRRVVGFISARAEARAASAANRS
jgi:hypothetical protein